jgi:antirestriction protein
MSNNFKDLYKLSKDPNFIGYKGVSLEESKQILKDNFLKPSEVLAPFNKDILKDCFGSLLEDMNDEEVERWVFKNVKWYNGSSLSLKNGLNVLRDFVRAASEGDVVLVIATDCESAKLSPEHTFVKDASRCWITGYIFQGDLFVP